MGVLWTPRGAQNAPDSLEALSKRDLIRLAKNLTNSLKTMSARAQLAACELHEVDKDNKIFQMSEGIFDKEHLYYIRKALKDGSYQKNRELARIK